MVNSKEAIALRPKASLREYQSYIHKLEAMHGWLDVDLIHNCFLMGEEVGELFKAIRKLEKYFDQENAPAKDEPERVAAVAEELVDVFNYLLALANRLDIDFEQSFREKNAKNQKRTWT